MSWSLVILLPGIIYFLFSVFNLLMMKARKLDETHAKDGIHQGIFLMMVLFLAYLDDHFILSGYKNEIQATIGEQSYWVFRVLHPFLMIAVVSKLIGPTKKLMISKTTYVSERKKFKSVR